MSKTLVWIIAAIVVVTPLTTFAESDVGAVVKACDDMHDAGKTCNYGIKGNSLVGCTDARCSSALLTVVGNALEAPILRESATQTEQPPAKSPRGISGRLTEKPSWTR